LNNVAKRRQGFTLVEVMVTSVLVGVALAGAIGALGSLSKADTAARNAELLQRLAVQKLAALRTEGDLRTAETSGDFSTEGYPEADWSLELQTTEDENVQEASITAVRGESQQVMSELVFFPPETTTTTTGTGG
jgi:prepilin-type N-terminal cleavage/methylation domain-containing protein